MKADDWVGLMLNRLARKRLFLPSDSAVWALAHGGGQWANSPETAEAPPLCTFTNTAENHGLGNVNLFTKISFPPRQVALSVMPLLVFWVWSRFSSVYWYPLTLFVCRISPVEVRASVCGPAVCVPALPLHHLCCVYPLFQPPQTFLFN